MQIYPKNNTLQHLGTYYPQTRICSKYPIFDGFWIEIDEYGEEFSLKTKRSLTPWMSE
jgi:hypothetical protein